MTDKRPDLTLLVGTANEHKLEEIRKVLEGTDVGGRRLRVVSSKVLPEATLADVGAVAETGATFAENAAIKARAFARAALKLPPARRPELVIADDSGLGVRALDGAPGVYSARYAGLDASDTDNNQKLLEDLRDVADGQRQAEFVCVIACLRLIDEFSGAVIPDGFHPGFSREEEIWFHVEGRCAGEILRSAHGRSGFGYDPLFFYPPLGKTFAELGDQKHAVSHRALALAHLRDVLESHVQVFQNDDPKL